MAWTDEELVARSIGGDSESFNHLMVRWERPIYALAYRVIGREEDARDVCQETFLRAFRALGGFKGRAKFSSWLYRIALNLCHDWLRRERRSRVVPAPEGIDLLDLAAARGPVESIEDRLGRQAMSRAIAKAMATLPDEQRTAIVLKEYHGLTFQEIADLVGCPLSTVKTRLYQGLTVLRRDLGVASSDARVEVSRSRALASDAGSRPAGRSADDEPAVPAAADVEARAGRSGVRRPPDGARFPRNLGGEGGKSAS